MADEVTRPTARAKAALARIIAVGQGGSGLVEAWEEFRRLPAEERAAVLGERLRSYSRDLRRGPGSAPPFEELGLVVHTALEDSTVAFDLLTEFESLLEHGPMELRIKMVVPMWNLYFAFGRPGSAARLWNWIESALTSDRKEIRMQALDSLRYVAFFASAGVVASVAGLMDSADQMERTKVASVLGAAVGGHPLGLEHVMPYLGDVQIAWSFLRGVVDGHCALSPSQLERVGELSSHARVEVRRALLGVLGKQVPSPAVLQTLRRLATDMDPAVRDAAKAALIAHADGDSPFDPFADDAPPRR